VDGQYSQRLNAWGGYQGFAVGVGRWLLGGDPPTTVQATIDRQGGQGIVRVELDPARKRGSDKDIRTATATVVSPARGEKTARIDLAWIGEDTLEARFPMQKPGVYLGAVQLGNGSVLPLAPITLPYSPEFEPRTDPAEGEKLLAQVARVTGGIERTTWADVFDASRLRSRQIRELVIPIALMLLMLHVLEIAGRRLLLFGTMQAWLRSRSLPRLRWPSRERPEPAPVVAAPGAPPAAAAPLPPSPRVAAPEKRKLATSALERAKGKARGRMER
jgi:hypothetical protein